MPRMLRRRWLFWQGSRPGILPGRSFALTAEWECEVCNGHKKETQGRYYRLGTVNPTGNTVAESWANIKAGRCAVGPITAFDTADFKVKLAAEVKDFDPAARIDKREARKMARFTQFAVAAADEAVRDSGLALEEIDHTRFGVILSSGIGGLPTIEEEHTRGQQRGFEKVSPYFVPMSIGNMAAGQIAIRFGLQGMCSCPTTACAGGTNAIGDAFHRIRDGYEDRMLCGGSESCISRWGWAALPA